MPATLEDIARISGFSRSTISRVINGDPAVSEDTRKRIIEVIGEQNYQPNLAARALAAGHTSVIGLVIPTSVRQLFTDPYFPILLQGISSGCNAKDYSVMLWLSEPEYERRTISKILYNGLVDGVIVSSMCSDDPILKALEESRFPFITIGRHPSNESIHSIDVDNRDGARQAVLHLLRLGRKRIGAISGPMNMIPGIDRYNGYVDALREHGIPARTELVAEADFTDTGGYYAARQLLDAHPDAIFAASDDMAHGALRALYEANLRVPQDVALVGFDDIPFARMTRPTLTTVRQPIYGLGLQAAQVLIEIIENPPDVPHHIILPTELVVRESCGGKAGRLVN